jgi:hypothetical protein
MVILPLEAILVHADRLDEAFCDFANTPKNHLVSFETYKKSYKAKGQECMKYVQYLLLMFVKSSKLECCLHIVPLSLKLDDALVMSLHVNRLSLFQANIPGVLMFY